MWPNLRDGDALLCVPAAGVKIGDVVCARRHGHQVVHRVMELAAGRVVLQGDLCPRPDAPLDERAILFRAVALERAGRRRRVPGRPRWPAVWRRLHAVARRLG